MPSRTRLELTSDLAYRLATDDAFRAELEGNPRTLLERLDVALDPERLPARVRLPEKSDCLHRFGFGARDAAAVTSAERRPNGDAPDSKGNSAGLRKTVKRHHLCFLWLRDRYSLGVDELLRGEISIFRGNELVAADLLAQTEHLISEAELEILAGVPSTRWIEVDRLKERFDEEVIDHLIEKGLLLASDVPEAASARRRDEEIAASRWEPYAALYHFMSVWGDVGLQEGDADRWDAYLNGGEGLNRVVARYGKPPAPFLSVLGAEAVPLPLVEDERIASRWPAERKTTRVFDRDGAMSLADLSSLLRHVFGCRGVAEVADGVVALQKTSPSGGGLHPIEAYPLVLRVQGLPPGLYHYDVRVHGLERIERLTLAEAEALANEFTAGQSYFQTAHVLVVLAARFYRNFWKYQVHKKAYRVLLLDAGHLSQTFYWSCAALGLGAFFTAAINEKNIADRLRLDAFEQGPLGICGCGTKLEGDAGLDLPVRPYAPGHDPGPPRREPPE